MVSFPASGCSGCSLQSLENPSNPMMTRVQVSAVARVWMLEIDVKKGSKFRFDLILWIMGIFSTKFLFQKSELMVIFSWNNPVCLVWLRRAAYRSALSYWFHWRKFLVNSKFWLNRSIKAVNDSIFNKVHFSESSWTRKLVRHSPNYAN